MMFTLHWTSLFKSNTHLHAFYNRCNNEICRVVQKCWKKREGSQDLTSDWCHNQIHTITQCQHAVSAVINSIITYEALKTFFFYNYIINKQLNNVFTRISLKWLCMNDYEMSRHIRARIVTLITCAITNNKGIFHPKIQRLYVQPT